jgi:hypothetical protein
MTDVLPEVFAVQYAGNGRWLAVAPNEERTLTRTFERTQTCLGSSLRHQLVVEPRALLSLVGIFTQFLRGFLDSPAQHAPGSSIRLYDVRRSVV